MAHFKLADGYEYDDNTLLSKIAEDIIGIIKGKIEGVSIQAYRGSLDGTGKVGPYDGIIYAIMQSTGNYNDYWSGYCTKTGKGFSAVRANACKQFNGGKEPNDNDGIFVKYFSEFVKKYSGKPTLKNLAEYINGNNLEGHAVGNKVKLLEILSVKSTNESDENTSQNAEGDKQNMKDKIIKMIKEGEIRQIIFTGAPGTGKTKIAKDIAGELGGELDGKKYHFVQFHPSYDYTDFVEGLRPVSIDNKMQFVKMDGTFKAFCREVVKANEETVALNRNLYFFIIDEINRADLSKVFGELMFCFEKDKRGKDNLVDTQYQNLPTYGIEEEDEFAEGFYIPENVVIIGTMNDIDRSVESMDFALRRRFEWQEFIVDEEMLKSAFNIFFKEKMDDAEIDKIIKSVRKLNKIIHGEEGQQFGLNRHYDISQGQFANIPHNEKTSAASVLKYVWTYRVESLLREYVRGEDETAVDGFVKKCKEAFGLTEQQVTEQKTND